VSDRDQEIAWAAKQILRYLHTHPEAADTVRGVTRWWLWQHQSWVTDELVEKALERLFQEGVMNRAITRSGEFIYRRSLPGKPANAS
jgi:hypothetical protein